MTTNNQTPAKPWYQSVTLWFNILSVIAIVVEQQLELIRPLVSDGVYAFIAIAVASFNLYLRLFVKRPVSLHKGGGNE